MARLLLNFIIQIHFFNTGHMIRVSHADQMLSWQDETWFNIIGNLNQFCTFKVCITDPLIPLLLMIIFAKPKFEENLKFGT